jgi:hypothetical protein
VFAVLLLANGARTCLSPSPLEQAQATHDAGPCLAFPHQVPPSCFFALKAPGYREDGVYRFLTWNLLFGSKDGTDYTPLLPAQVVSMGSAPESEDNAAAGHRLEC